MTRVLWGAALLLFTACGGAPANAVGPAPDSAATAKKTWNLFPPDWHVGDAWEVESTTTQRSPLDRSRFHQVTRNHVYRVIEAPGPSGGDYVLQVVCTDPGVADTYRLVFRGSDLSCTVADRSVGGDPPTLQSFGRKRTEGGPFLGIGLGAEIILDFPVRPDPAQPWVLVDLPNDGFEWGGGRTQQMEYDGIGVTFRLTLRQWSLTMGYNRSEVPTDIRTVIRWKEGDPWWSQIEREEQLDRDLPWGLTAHARLTRVLRYAAGSNTPP